MLVTNILHCCHGNNNNEFVLSNFVKGSAIEIVVTCDVQPNPTKGKMRIHCLENVDKSLTFLNEQRVHLENMGAHDIVDGNPRLTLGLIWTIILRFQVPTASSTKCRSTAMT